jgi:lipopolysaccharide transport system permease protein
VLGGLVDFAVSFVVLLVLMLYYRVQPTLGVLLLPVFLLLATITALGVGLWLSALNVKYRDVHYVVPFLTQLWFYATPIIYESSWFENPLLRTIVSLNPMVGVVEGFRWALLASDPPKLMIAVSSVMAIVVLLSGAYYFRRMEKSFADIL